MKPSHSDKIASSSQGHESVLSGMSTYDILKIYLAQRFNIAVYGSLAIYLLLFTKAELTFVAADVVSWVVILFFLLSMRSYDDLQNIDVDQQKPDRIYTNPAAAKKLYILFLFCAVIVVGLTMIWGRTSAITLLTFYIVNHALYILFVRRANWRYFLPFLKYPLITVLVSGSWATSHLSLFFIFLTFDIMEDTTFPLPRWAAIPSSLLAFALIVVPDAEISYFLYAAIGIAAAALTQIRHRLIPYAFLAFFLLTKLSGTI